MNSAEQTYEFTAPGTLTLDYTGDMYGSGRIEKSDGEGGWTSDHDDPQRIGSHEESVIFTGTGDYRVVYRTHGCLDGTTAWTFVYSGVSPGPTILVPGDGTTPWTDVTANAATSEGMVEKTGGVAWAEGASFGSIPADTDGALYWKSGGSVSGTVMMLGTFTSTDAWATTDQFHHGIFVGDASSTSVYAGTSPVAALVATNATIELGIRRVGTDFEFLRGGTVVWTVNGVPTVELFASGRFYNYLGSTIQDVRMEVG